VIQRQDTEAAMSFRKNVKTLTGGGEEEDVAGDES